MVGSILKMFAEFNYRLNKFIERVRNFNEYRNSRDFI